MLIQSKSVTGAGASASLTFTTAPSAGNLLVAFIGIRSDSGTITPPSGWTEAVAQYNNAPHSAAIAYKISDGSESGSITFTWVNTRRSAFIIAEYDSVESLDVDADDRNRSTVNVTSLACGTIASANRDQAEQLAVAAFTAQDSDAWDTGEAFDNGFTIDVNENINLSGRPSAILATKTVTATGDITTTASTTDVGDLCVGFLFAVNSAAGGFPGELLDARRMIAVP